jgi:hypothetical protein
MQVPSRAVSGINSSHRKIGEGLIANAGLSECSVEDVEAERRGLDAE